MKMRIIFTISLGITISAFILLVTASPKLMFELFTDPSVPIGNILTWLGFMGLPISIYSGIQSIRDPKSSFKSVLKIALVLSMILGLLWIPVSYFLADNWSASFSNNDGFRGSVKAGKYFWNYSYLTVGLPLAVLVLHWLSAIIRLFKK